MICHVRVCCYHDQARGFHGALKKKIVVTSEISILKVLIHAHRINAFQKHSADSKLSTNTYLMYVAAVFQKL